jgi:phosphomannomutase / phosphoglucomutase
LDLPAFTREAYPTLYDFSLNLQTVNPDIFREFSIRGQADVDLPDAVVEKIGQAVGTYFVRRAGTVLVMGRDVRLSSPRLSAALGRGLIGTGQTVIDVGLVPTPALNFAVDHFEAAGGVMVTASHNPPADNGFKIRGQETVYGSALQEIYRLAETEDFDEAEGRILPTKVLPAYTATLIDRAHLARSLTIVVDGGHGVTGRVMAELLHGLGCTIHEIFSEPDGAFPDRNPDPTRPGALGALVEGVLYHGADAGLAFDGDGDRLVSVDDRGRVQLGDRLLTLLARDLLAAGPATVVYDLSSSRALADEVEAQGGRAVAAPVGYPFVQQKMRETGAALGGESSGHIFFGDPLIRFDDALLASLKLLSIISHSAVPFSTLLDRLPAYHSAPALRLACPDSLKSQVVAGVRSVLAERYRIDETDGVQVDFGRGWALIRQSNTQPALTVHLEATTAEDLDRLQPFVLDTVARSMQAVGCDLPPELTPVKRV